ncbi:MAG: hypothetical protein C5B50_04535 [Verrucomicrobia bacterium]|nr:MAG: hypothetical protein C5B50_04535 [Verrucomicrobiota bacterium]
MLPPETERVWNFLKAQHELGGFVLIGGSGLALRIGHRLSEDLDLAWPERRLPRARLEALRRIADASRFDFQLQEDQATTDEFADAGLDIHDFHQNYLVDGRVRVSFFAPEPPLVAVLRGAAEATVRVASLPELFKSKCLVSAQRSKTRDWVDLYLLLRDHGFTMRDYRAAFVKAGEVSQYETGLSRICSGVPQRDDEGYAHLLSNAPSVEEMKKFFVAKRDQLEVELAAEALQKKTKPQG